MKNLFLLVVIALLSFAASCGASADAQDTSSDNNTTEITNFDWRVVSKSVDGEVSDASAEYLLTFQENNGCRLSLDINNCDSSFGLEGDDNISFLGMGCTEACCDTEWAYNMSESFSNITSYAQSENILHFYLGDDWIKLEMVQ